MRQSFIASASIILAIVIAAGCSKRPETITIAFSNDTEGVIRSCGCAAKDFGGLGRRATFVRLSRDTASNYILLDGGDFFGTEINYGEEKAELTMKAMTLMGYDAVVLGEKDFSFGLEYIKSHVEKIGLPVVLTNVFKADTDSLLFPEYRIIERPGGLKIAVLGALGNRLQLPHKMKAEDMSVRPPETATAATVARIRPHVDVIIVLAHMTIKEAWNLAEKISGIDLIICGHDGRSMRRLRRINNAYVLQVPREGMYMGLANCVLSKGKRGVERRIETVTTSNEALSKMYRDDEAVAKLFEAYDMDIALKEQSDMPTGILTSGTAPKKPFVGAAGCKECHEREYALWQETAHAHAFEILVDHARHYDRDCTPCHVTGFYKAGGFVNYASTPDLIHVQCESCHGNGFDHAGTPSTKMPDSPRSTCRKCHNEDQTPNFSFDDFWPKIAH